MSDHPEIEDLIHGYVLDAIAYADREEVQAQLLEHLAVCSSCRETFASSRATAADLALAPGPAVVSDALEERLMSTVRDLGAPQPQPARRTSMLVRGLAAAAAIVALGVSTARFASDASRERSRASRAAAAFALANDPSTRRIALTGSQGSVTLVLAGNGSAFLMGTGFPALPRDRVFEVWLVRGGTAAPAGVFAPVDGVAIVALGVDPISYDEIAITIERGSRGAQAPTSPMLYRGAIRA